MSVSASDLVGHYVGQTAPKTVSVLKKGLGKVLFLDEAYRLTLSTHVLWQVPKLHLTKPS